MNFSFQYFRGDYKSPIDDVNSCEIKIRQIDQILEQKVKNFRSKQIREYQLRNFGLTFPTDLHNS